MQTESVAHRLADQVRGEMARRRVSQTSLAHGLGLSQAAVSRRLSGTVDFTVTEIHAIAEILDVDPGDLFGSSARGERVSS